MFSTDREPSVGLAHDYLLVMRGAERSFDALARIWPEAPIYTTLYDPEGTEHRFANRTVHTSPLQRLPLRQRGFRRLLPAYPWAVERLDMTGHDIVVSSSSAFAHGVRVREDAVHVSYCYTPFRYAWHEREATLARASSLTRPLLRRTLERIRDWDRRAQSRVTRHVAIGRVSQQRIAEAYGRHAEIVHPPVEVDRFTPGEPEDFVLVVGELVNHKRVDVALAAAERAGLPVKVVGGGPHEECLRQRFPAAEFLGRLPDAALARLYARALVHVVCATEEFGITAVEAQAAGRPVIAPRAGGALETVRDGETGVLIDRVDVDTVADALTGIDFTGFTPDACVRSAARFSVEAFQRNIRAQVAAAIGSDAGSSRGDGHRDQDDDRHLDRATG